MNSQRDTKKKHPKGTIKKHNALSYDHFRDRFCFVMLTPRGICTDKATQEHPKREKRTVNNQIINVLIKKDLLRFQRLFLGVL